MFCPNCGTQNPDTAQVCSKCTFHLKSASAPKFKGTMLMMNQPGGIPGAPPAPPLNPPAGAARPVGAVGHTPGAGAPGPGGGPNKLKGTMVGVAPPMGMMGGGAPPPQASPPAVPPGAGYGAYGAPPPAGPSMPQAGGPGHGADAASFSPPVPQGGVNPLGGTVAADAAPYMASGMGAAGAYGAQHNQSPGAPAQGSGGFGPPQGQQPGYGPPQAQGGFPQGQGGYAPPQGQGGYAPAQAQGGYAPPQGQGGYGAPQAQGGYGSPQAPEGAMQFGPPGQGPPQAYGAPPNQYGAPNPYAPQQGYGAPPMAQPGGMMPYPQQPPGPLLAQGTLQSAVAPTPPQRRNPLMTWLMPFAVIFGGIILSTILSFVSISLGSLAYLLFVLGGSVWYLLLAVQMTNELKTVTRNPNFAWWPILVPFYGMFWAWILVPQEVAKAKQMTGVQAPPRPLILYIFLWHFALASDLNDLAK